MTCTLIVIGQLGSNRLPVDLELPEGALVDAWCPDCENGHRYAAALDTTHESGHRIVKLTKPAETWVFKFPDQAVAQTWLEATPARFAGKTIVLIDPECAT